jgi:hypothetical protein
MTNGKAKKKSPLIKYETLGNEKRDNKNEEDDADQYKNYELAKLIIRDYFPDNNTQQTPENFDPENQPETIQKVIDKGVQIIIGFIASFISDILQEEDQTAELTIMIVIVYSIWFSLDQFIRFYIVRLWVVQKSTVYRDVIIACVNLVSYLGMYLLAKLGLDILNNLWKSSSINTGEAFVSLSSICVSLYSVYFVYEHLNK